MARPTAEARLDALVADLRGLVDEWEGAVYKLPLGSGMTADEFSAHWFKRPLRAVLDKHAGEQP